MIGFTQDVTGNLEQALNREWLETNGLGSFACSTIAGANTRRYHGLLTACTRPPVGRVLLLSKLEEALAVGNERFELATNEYEGAVHPAGYRYLVEFRLDPFPVFTYDCGGVRLEKVILMVYGSHTTVVQYRVLEKPAQTAVHLEVRPLVAFREYHSTTHENSALEATVQKQANLASVAPYQGLPRLYFSHDALRIDDQGFWYRNFVYRVERDRGLDYREDLYSPFALNFSFNGSNTVSLIASTEPQDVTQAPELRQAELARRSAVVATAPVADDFVRALTAAADQFVVRRESGYTVIAGYPWFTDWGRDTMIALPGLTLFNGHSDVARSILLTFAKHVDQGMLPNHFPEMGERAEFNTVDATLWLFEAMRAYTAQSGDYGTVQEQLYDVLSDIVDWHIKGTRYNIRMLENGLLNAGQPGVQLTWMDAKVDDWVVTPRSGQPVEIQALWFNALKIMEEFATRFDKVEDEKRFRNISGLLQSTFNRAFWNKEANCLYDVVNGAADASIRPNQILAVSLHHSMLPQERARAVVDLVERELLTPYGLRTLNRGNPQYVARYAGDRVSRDAAYHQGTVWPWLIGPFISAYMKVHGSSPATRERALELLQPLKTHLQNNGVGQISEVFDADPPHRAGGCFAQAWSVAEVLRALCEDVYQPAATEKLPGVRAPKATPPTPATKRQASVTRQ
ncbi:MAG: amylo-alpha-1,6-glucosidase [Acidobacteriales bacterium]|nr:amylo-alpha-1,6-glucosidase [Terriglobales bacterium]